MNHLIFIVHTTIISGLTIIFGRMGQAALTSYISLLFVLANIFVIKQMELLNFSVTCADAYIIGVSFGINLLQEIWGKKVAQKAIFISFACSIFYLVMGYLHLAYSPASYDTSHIHFAYLLTNTLRITIASFISYLIVQYADTIMYGYLKTKMHDNHFVVRNYISMLTSQLFDTILFSFLGLYGIVHNLTHIMIISYAIKVAAIFLSTPFIYYAKRALSSYDKSSTDLRQKP